MRRIGLTLAAMAIAMPVLAQDAPKICYREDAAPFSFIDEAKEPNGYSVGLCQRILSALGTDDPEMVVVTAEDRFTSLQNGDCDLLCEATTVTMQRRAEMEFSLITFLTGAVFLYPKELLNGKYSEGDVTVGILSKTTAFDKWKSGDLRGGTGVEFVFEEQKSHEDAEAALLEGGLDGYIADQEIIEQIVANNPQLEKSHLISKSTLSYEPYALAMRMGDDELRVQVDEVLAEMYRSNEILDLLDKHLPGRSGDKLLTNLFELQSLPE